MYLGGGLLTEGSRGARSTPLATTSPSSWGTGTPFDLAQVRRAVHATKITTQMAADAYLAALASPDPGQNQRPTAAAAEKLGASRGHISRLLSQARREGIEGLGPQRAATAQGGEGLMATPKKITLADGSVRYRIMFDIGRVGVIDEVTGEPKISKDGKPVTKRRQLTKTYDKKKDAQAELDRVAHQREQGHLRAAVEAHAGRDAGRLAGVRDLREGGGHPQQLRARAAARPGAAGEAPRPVDHA